MRYVKLRRSKPGTYTFDTWGDASQFCQKNELPVEDIENVYLNYKVTIEN